MEFTTGIVVKAHGIRGDLVVDVRTDSPEERFIPGKTITLRETSGVTSTFEVTTARWHQGRLLVKLDGIDDRTAADNLRQAQFLVDSSEVELDSTDDPNEYHIGALIGMTVHDSDGNKLGTITDVLTNRAQDLLTVTDEEGKTHLIPFVAEIVPDVDSGAGTILVDLPEGLWEL